MSVVLNEEALITAADKMRALYERNVKLRNNIAEHYEKVTTALDTPVGEKLKWVSTNTLLAPIDDMSNVLEYMADLLELIIGRGGTKNVYYDKVFEEYHELERLINENQ